MSDTGLINIVDYTDKSIVVTGDTKMYSQYFKDLGGRWNGRLRDGLKGWIFTRAKEDDVVNLINAINAGQLVASDITNTRANVRDNARDNVRSNNRNNLQSPTNRQTLKYNPRISPNTVKYPNLFDGADGKTYRMIMYTIPYLEVGKPVFLQMGDQNGSYEYTIIEVRGDNMDVALMESIGLDETGNQQVLELVVCGGEWKIKGFNEEHQVYI